MRPMFTIHIGEYLVADYIERQYGKKCGIQVWVPSKDTGIDLLVTDKKCRKTVSLQVKYSKSYDCESDFDATGWWRLNREKIVKSHADYWVFVVPEYMGKRLVSSCCFVILAPSELIKRLEQIHGNERVYNMYLTIKGGIVIETREANVEERNKQFITPRGYRNFSRFLNKWDNVLAKFSKSK